MSDPTYILYTALKQKFPLDLEEADQDLAQSLEEIQTKIKTFPLEYQHFFLEVQDDLRYKAVLESQHTFDLGLDFGMSLGKELHFQSEDAL